MWGVLMMVSTVALFLGLLIATVAKTWQVAAPAVLACFAVISLLGGWFWPMSGKSLPISAAAAATPARWAFEALLLLESPYHSPPESDGSSVATPEPDLAEDSSPPIPRRMGRRADAMALGSMLIGMVAAVALRTARPD